MRISRKVASIAENGIPLGYREAAGVAISDVPCQRGLGRSTGRMKSIVWVKDQLMWNVLHLSVESDIN